MPDTDESTDGYTLWTSVLRRLLQYASGPHQDTAARDKTCTHSPFTSPSNPVATVDLSLSTPLLTRVQQSAPTLNMRCGLILRHARYRRWDVISTMAVVSTRYSWSYSIHIADDSSPWELLWHSPSTSLHASHIRTVIQSPAMASPSPMVCVEIHLSGSCRSLLNCLMYARNCLLRLRLASAALLAAFGLMKVWCALTYMYVSNKFSSRIKFASLT